jgi:hypothetical protein
MILLYKTAADLCKTGTDLAKTVTDLSKTATDLANKMVFFHRNMILKPNRRRLCVTRFADLKGERH